MLALYKSSGYSRYLKLVPPVITTRHRNYALSRFPDRNPGVGRKRQTPDYRQHPPARARDVPHEERPSAEGSPLWQESFRPPAGNPEHGLNKLLMSYDSLVVTRSVIPQTPWMTSVQFVDVLAR
jgi:hypothetical protein